MEEEICCKSKQVEKKADGRVLNRCMSQKSTYHLEVIQPSACSSCPVRVSCGPEPTTISHPQSKYEYFEGYSFCEYRAMKNGKPTCTVTGLPVTPEQCNRCDEETRDRVAKLGDKLSGYASAIKRWVAAGRPTRTEEEQKQILEEHCYQCEMFDKEKHSCKNCGCSLALTGNPLTSKVAMKTEKCPLGRW